jgi:hypothetical protein
LRGRRVFYELRRKSLEFARQIFVRAIVSKLPKTTILPVIDHTQFLPPA